MPGARVREDRTLGCGAVGYQATSFGGAVLCGGVHFGTARLGDFSPWPRSLEPLDTERQYSKLSF